MPRLQDTILDCVVYLYGSFHAADEGIQMGGSGFVVHVPCENQEIKDAGHWYAVTNKHVIAAGFPCVRFNTMEGKKLVVEAKASDWITSEKDDLAIVRMPEMPTQLAVNTIPLNCLVTEDMIETYDIGVGDDVLMLGRFINREGLQKNAPTARFGQISQLASDPIEVHIGGKPFSQDGAILCEVRSIGGYSGSPVFILPNPAYGRKGEALPADRGVLLGVDFCHIQDWVLPRDERGNEMPHMRVPINTGMAGVIPAWRLNGMIMSKEEVERRKAAEENYLKKKK